jgi:DNA-binding response OmpR family regulator
MTTQHILALNDDQDILELFRVALEEEGYEVTVSLIVFEKLADIEQLRPDLILLDLRMGKEWEGWHLLQRLKMHQPTASIPVIICSAAVNEVGKHLDYLRQHDIPIVYKPFDLDELLQQVRQTLQSATSAAP